MTPTEKPTIAAWAVTLVFSPLWIGLRAMTADLIAKLEAAESGRPAVRTAKELEALSGRDEVVEGYLDGLQGDLEPGPNRSDGYYHGWRNGANGRRATMRSAWVCLWSNPSTPPLLQGRLE